MMGRPLDSYRGARRNALRGGFYLDMDVGRMQYLPSSWPTRRVKTKPSTYGRRWYRKIVSTWHRLNRKGKEHAHARAMARQARNNPTCPVLTAAELDAASEALA